MLYLHWEASTIYRTCLLFILKVHNLFFLFHRITNRIKACLKTKKKKILKIQLFHYGCLYLFVKIKYRFLIGKNWKFKLNLEKFNEIILLEELSENEPDDFKNYLRMYTSNFDYLLKIVGPTYKSKIQLCVSASSIDNRRTKNVLQNLYIFRQNLRLYGIYFLIFN